MGFEPTQLALVELESTPLDHSGKLSCCYCAFEKTVDEGLALPAFGERVILQSLAFLHFT